MTKISKEESDVLVKSLNNICEDVDFIENYGMEATIALNNLIGRLKDDFPDPISNAKVNNVRNFESCFISKANEWQKDYENDDVDTSFYRLVYDEVINTFIKDEFHTFANESAPKQTIATLFFMLKEHCAVAVVQQSMSLRLSAMSCYEYNEVSVCELLEQFIALCLENSH